MAVVSVYIIWWFVLLHGTRIILNILALLISVRWKLAKEAQLIVSRAPVSVWSLKVITLLQIESLECTVDCTLLAVEKVWCWRRMTSRTAKLQVTCRYPIFFTNNMGLARVSQDCIVNILQERKFPEGTTWANTGAKTLSCLLLRSHFYPSYCSVQINGALISSVKPSSLQVIRFI